MNIVFRVDSSEQIGTGHVMRCVTLAQMLRQQGAQIFFVCRSDTGHLNNWIQEQGFPLFELTYGIFHQKNDAVATVQVLKKMNLNIDWLIVDHYELDAQWEKIVYDFVQHVMVIDDLANRKHVCDCLLDQNYLKDMEKRYEAFVPTNCHLMLGPSYLLLRNEFYEAKKKWPRSFREEVRRMLIFYGGSDPTNETEKVLQAIEKVGVPKRLHIDVVIGNANRKKETIKKLSKSLSASFHCQIDYLAELIAKADVSFGAGGVTMWERCFLGLPSLVTVVAENQKATTEAAAEAGAVVNVGWHNDVTVSHYEKELLKVFQNRYPLQDIAKKGMAIMNSNGSPSHIHPVVRYLLGL